MNITSHEDTNMYDKLKWIRNGYAQSCLEVKDYDGSWISVKEKKREILDPQKKLKQMKAGYIR